MLTSCTRRDVADIINRSTDVEFQERMYELAGCAPDNLADTIQVGTAAPRQKPQLLMRACI